MREVLLQLGIEPSVPNAESQLDFVVTEVVRGVATSPWQLSRLMAPPSAEELQALRECLRAESSAGTAESAGLSRETMRAIARCRVEQVLSR